MSHPAPTVEEVWEDTVRDLMADISEIRAEWQNQPRGYQAPQEHATVRLRVTSVQPVGVDETRTVIDDTKLTTNPPVEVEPSQVGLEITTLQIQVEAQEHRANTRARHFLKRIKTRLRRPSSLATLRDVNTSLIDIGVITVLDLVQDIRARSLATMDVRLHTGVDERDDAFGRIDRLGITANVTDASGATVATVTQTIDLPDP